MKSSKQFIAILLITLIVILIPIRARSGVIYLKNGKAIANAKGLEIKDQHINYTVGGKAYRIKLEDVKGIEWISDKPKSKKDQSEESDERNDEDTLTDNSPQAQVKRENTALRKRAAYTREELDKIALRNMDCLLEKYTPKELKKFPDEKLERELLLCIEDKKGPLLYPKGGKHDWSESSDEPTQKIWGYEIPLDPVKRKQYFEDMEEENRRLETEIFGRPLE